MFDNHRNVQNSFVTFTFLAIEMEQLIELLRKSEDLVDEHFIFVFFLLTVELCSLLVEPILGFSFDNFVKSITQRIEVF